MAEYPERTEQQKRIDEQKRLVEPCDVQIGETNCVKKDQATESQNERYEEIARFPYIDPLSFPGQQAEKCKR